MAQLTLNEQDRNRIKEQLVKFKIGSEPTPSVIVQEDSQFMTIFLSTVMILLTLVMMLSFAFKIKPNQYVQSPIPIIEPNIEQKFEDDAADKEVEEVVVEKEAVGEDVQKLKVAVNQLSHQIWMLGLQGNQNTAINKQIDKEYHAGKFSNRYVVVNRSWGLDKKPDSINFSEDDLKKLQEHLNLK